MACTNNNGTLVDALVANIGRIVTVFTKSGGATGCGFTGLLVKADNNSIKLVTQPASAPPHPFGNQFNSGNFGNRCCRDELGTSVVIPTDAVASCAFKEL